MTRLGYNSSLEIITSRNPFQSCWPLTILLKWHLLGDLKLFVKDSFFNHIFQYKIGQIATEKNIPHLKYYTHFKHKKTRQGQAADK